MKMHEEWMSLAIQLAKATAGQTAPNPQVGALVIKEGRLLVSGVHVQAGQSHAERLVLDIAGEQAKGSTLYVTLEPCIHEGRTPPCVEAIIAAGVKEVVVGCLDPDERACGRGITYLKRAGIKVIQGVLANACFKINEGYFHHRRTKFPFVTMKIASTLDGRIASITGDSSYITGMRARAYVQKIRQASDAILTGIGTVLADNPRLYIHQHKNNQTQPLRVILDSFLRVPMNARILKQKEAPTCIFTTKMADMQKYKALSDKGIEIYIFDEGNNISPSFVLRKLGEKGIINLLVEAGSKVNASFLQADLVQRMIYFIAPKILGGEHSLVSVGGKNPLFIKEAWSLKDIQLEQLDDDICLSGYVVQGS